jgi:DNA repair photolyase
MPDIIYQPAGRAEEYSPLAANLYRGCEHGCLYCFAPSATWTKRKDFHKNVAPRKDVLKWLERNAPKYSGQEVLMCFTCDPYTPCENQHGVTREAIKILHRHGVSVNLLTKGGQRAVRDFDLLSKRPGLSRIGATLTFDNEMDSLKWEPKADTPANRIAMLRKAKEMGIKTWASLEPVIEPEQTLELIKMSAPYVDKYKVGRWNYDKRANEINWKDFLMKAMQAMRERDVNFYIKNDLAVFWKEGLA